MSLSLLLVVLKTLTGYGPGQPALVYPALSSVCWKKQFPNLPTSTMMCFCEMIKQEGISFSFAFPTVDFSLLQMAQLLGISD